MRGGESYELLTQVILRSRIAFDKVFAIIPPMKEKLSVSSALLLFILTGGCVSIQEMTKTLWGSSTRALEKARTTALTKTFRGDWEACFEKVLTLTRLQPVIPDTNPG